MPKFETFHYKSMEGLVQDIAKLGLNINTTKNVQVLKNNIKIGKKISENAIAILPMEGCDSDLEGNPTDLTTRRYTRYAEGGAGLIWFEACSVKKEGKANPRQLSINEVTVGNIKDLVNIVNEKAIAANGVRPITILQLTHSGRWARPVDKPSPVITQHDPILDPVVGIDNDYPVVTDTELDSLMDDYVKAAILAKEAGFDGVDIKLAHRYLLSELLASYLRKGKYGGSFGNRTRFGLETIGRVREAVGGDFLIGCRLSMYDAHPYPYGWGVDKEDFWKVDLSEPLRLVKLLVENGIDFINASLGNVYYKYPYLTRPYDTPTLGSPLPHEHPLESIKRILEITKEVKNVAKEIPVIGSGYSWLRQFMFNVGAANIENGEVDMIGMGRMAFAYPSAPKELFEKGEIDRRKVCITCSRCTQLMRDHSVTGCVIRDREIYDPLYKSFRKSPDNSK